MQNTLHKLCWVTKVITQLSLNQWLKQFVQVIFDNNISVGIEREKVV